MGIFGYISSELIELHQHCKVFFFIVCLIRITAEPLVM